MIGPSSLFATLEIQIRCVETVLDHCCVQPVGYKTKSSDVSRWQLGAAAVPLSTSVILYRLVLSTHTDLILMLLKHTEQAVA